MNNQITVTQQSRFSTKHAEQFRAIYLDSFPPQERAEFSSLLESVARGGRWFFAATRDDNLLGFAIIVPRVASDVHLLEYLAVDVNARNNGIGGMLLQSVVAAIRDSQSATSMLIEVEPDDEGDDNERRLRVRRIEFYRRYGARVVEDATNYRVPLADRDGTMRMKLLWLPIVQNADVPRDDKLRECVRGIGEKSYGMRDDELSSMEIANSN